MEKLQQIKQTLSEIDDRTPDALRVAFGLGYRVSPAPAPGEEDRVASFADSVLPPPPPVSEDADANDPGELHEEVPLDSTSDDDAAKVLRMEWASCYLPDHDEDAHFGHGDAGVVGVADGVGGYRELGEDAAAFSRGLMTSALMHVLAIDPGTPVCPYTLLERAYDETVASAASGASTAVILSLAGATLKWAYIGDSAFAVLRGGNIVHRSREQKTYFDNCPFQLSSPGQGDSITEADVGEMPVRDGDVVVAGTDGLFDNVFDAELERVVRMGTAQGYSPKNMADVTAGIAYEMSRSPTKDSPISTEYQKKVAGVEFHGGKPDDITVVVAFIRDLS